MGSQKSMPVDDLRSRVRATLSNLTPEQEYTLRTKFGIHKDDVLSVSDAELSALLQLLTTRKKQKR